VGNNMHSLILWLMGIASSVLDWFPWRKKAKPTGRESKKYVVNDFHFPGNAAHKPQRNKKYADQGQKAKRNRRKKPSKKMRRLYQLERSKAHPHRSRV